MAGIQLAFSLQQGQQPQLAFHLANRQQGPASPYPERARQNQQAEQRLAQRHHLRIKLHGHIDRLR